MRLLHTGHSSAQFLAISRRHLLKATATSRTEPFHRLLCALDAGSSPPFHAACRALDPGSPHAVRLLRSGNAPPPMMHSAPRSTALTAHAPSADASLFRHPARPLTPLAGPRSLPPYRANATARWAQWHRRSASSLRLSPPNKPLPRPVALNVPEDGCRLGYEAASPLSRTEFSSFALARGRLGHRRHSSRPHRAIFKQGLLAADGDVDRVRDHLRQVGEVCIVEVGRQLEVVCRRE